MLIFGKVGTFLTEAVTILRNAFNGEGKTSQVHVTWKKPHDHETSKTRTHRAEFLLGYLRTVRLWTSCVTSLRLFFIYRMVRIVVFRDDNEYQVAGMVTDTKQKPGE